MLPLGALVIALYIKNAYSILMFAWSFYAAAAGLPAFAALFWKKATSAGILSAMVAGFVVCVGWKLAGRAVWPRVRCARDHRLRDLLGGGEPGYVQAIPLSVFEGRKADLRKERLSGCRRI